MNSIKNLYNTLLKEYGSQGWWPLLDVKGINPTKTGSINGYHPNDYNYPKTNTQKFEICLGAVLTQNTSWPNVEKALQNLKKNNLIEPKKILELENTKLGELIKPAGYFNQKTKKLKIFSEFYLKLNDNTPTRTELLELWGIGPETADSILLYAYKKSEFVVDAYTKRIFINLKLIQENSKYEEIKSLIESNIEKDYKIYQEFHALLVEQGKRYYQKKPYKDTLIKL